MITELKSRRDRSLESHERIDLPVVVIRPHSPLEELDYLWHVLKRIPFYRDHGYTYELPSHKRFVKLASMSPNFDGVDRDEIRNIFENEVYDPTFYTPGVQLLERRRVDVEGVFPSFLQMQRNWGFRVFPQYSVLLTRYGPGGNYDEDKGEVVMLTRADGSSKIDPVHNVDQEMIHIGTEKDIVEKFRLTHPEKERLVDLISVKRFPQIFTGFNMQAVGDSRIDTYVTDEAIENNLPNAIENYVQAFPRV